MKSALGRTATQLRNMSAVDPIPGRTEVLIANLIFVVSSVLLLLEFTSIQYHWPYDLITEGQSWNWLGALSCVGWFFGFAILIDWIVFSTFPVWGFDRQALAGATLKLIASVLFCIQPFAALAGYNPDGQPPFSGVPWSNFAGICFFHAGNMLNAIGMLKLIDTRAPFLANAPSFGMIIFACATWFLVIADGIYYFSLPKPNGPGVDVGSAKNFVKYGQVIGATLLLVGSLLYTVWSLVFGRVKEPEPLLRVQPLNSSSR